MAQLLSSTRCYALAALLLAAPFAARAQSGGVRIGTAGAPDANAALDISATGKGLLIPRMDSAARAQITPPPDGLMAVQSARPPQPEQQQHPVSGGAHWLYHHPAKLSGSLLPECGRRAAARQAARFPYQLHLMPCKAKCTGHANSYPKLG